MEGLLTLDLPVEVDGDGDGHRNAGAYIRLVSRQTNWIYGYVVFEGEIAEIVVGLRGGAVGGADLYYGAPVILTGYAEAHRNLGAAPGIIDDPHGGGAGGHGDETVLDLGLGGSRDHEQHGHCREKNANGEAQRVPPRRDVACHYLTETGGGIRHRLGDLLTRAIASVRVDAYASIVKKSVGWTAVVTSRAALV